MKNARGSHIALFLTFTRHASRHSRISPHLLLHTTSHVPPAPHCLLHRYAGRCVLPLRTAAHTFHAHVLHSLRRTFHCTASSLSISGDMSLDSMAVSSLATWSREIACIIAGQNSLHRQNHHDGDMDGISGRR